MKFKENMCVVCLSIIIQQHCNPVPSRQKELDNFLRLFLVHISMGFFFVKMGCKKQCTTMYKLIKQCTIVI